MGIDIDHYLARISNIVTMSEYFSRMYEGRTDSIYSLTDGELVRNHHLWNKGVHIDEKQNIRDIAGEYVLLSDDFIYLGKDAVFVDLVDKYNARFRETKLYKGEIAELIDIVNTTLHIFFKIHKSAENLHSHGA